MTSRDQILARKRENSRRLRANPSYKEREREYMVAYRKDPKVKAQRVVNQVRYERKLKYGLTDEDILKLKEAQNFSCAICGDENPSSWHIDHCHTTGKVRAILCHHCNVGLGFFRDSPDNLVKAANYLIHHKNI